MSAKWFAPRTILSSFDIGKLTCLEHGQNKPWHCKIPNTSKNYWIQVFLFHEKGMGTTSPSPFVMLWEVFHPKSCFHVEIFNLQGPTLWKCLGERTTWDVSDDVWWIVWIVVGKKNCGSFGMMQNLVSRYFCHLGRTLMKPWNRLDDDKTTLFFISLCKTSGGSSDGRRIILSSSRAMGTWPQFGWIHPLDESGWVAGLLLEMQVWDVKSNEDVCSFIKEKLHNSSDAEAKIECGV